MSWLAVDIGGANIKAADGQGYAASHVFPLWKNRQNLAVTLRSVLADAPAADHLAATMTGELADCYRTKTEGVTCILDDLISAADGRHTRVYLTSGKLVSPQVAKRKPLEAAAANWHALARFVGRLVPSGTALLLDVGSTTTDLIPLVEGEPAAKGLTDPERLMAGELVYTGVDRSPVCAITSALPWHGRQCPTANEVFATARDAYLMLGDLPQDGADSNTADGRPATREFAWERLARSICADRDLFDERDAVASAEAIQRAQLAKFALAFNRVVKHLSEKPRTIVISGRGEFLARRFAEQLGYSPAVIALGDQYGPAISRCAPAHALAVLAAGGG